MTKEELDALIDGGSAEACVVAFEGMPEAERKKLGAAAVAHLRTLGKLVPGRISIAFDSELEPRIMQLLSIDESVPARFRAARVAALATASLGQWKGVRRHGLPSNELTLRILRDRRPPWLDELLELVCEEDDGLVRRWPLIRGLVREGLCQPPKSGRYIDRMLNGLVDQASRHPGGLRAVLLEDSGLLEHEIWRMFETEPGPRAVQLISAGMQVGKPEATWEVALPALASEGRIPRERLLDACLDGLSRDLHDLRARLFGAIHDRLAPTAEEMSARSTRYLELLGSRNPSAITFVLRAVRGLLKSGRVQLADLVERLATALHARTKATVKQALTLLDQAVRQQEDPALRLRAVALATEALIHEAADLQGAVLDFVELHGDSQNSTLRDLIQERSSGVAASLQGRLAAWLGTPAAAPEYEGAAVDICDLERRAAALDPRLSILAGVPEALAAARGQRRDLPALTFDGTEIPRLDPARRLEPISDLDDLIDRCILLVDRVELAYLAADGAEPVEEVDHCLDAISRLCDQRPADFQRRTAPLVAWLRKRYGERDYLPATAVHALPLVIWSWLTGKEPLPYPLGGPAGLVQSLARRAARGIAAPLLFTPTHAGGWIDPPVLIERFRQRSRLPIADDPEELVLAILRLAPDHRSAALGDARDYRGEQGAAIRYALGSSDEAIGPSAPLWVAAARARKPWADDPAVETRHPELGPDAGRAAAYAIDGKALVRRVGGTVQLRIDRVPPLPEGSKGSATLPTVALHSVEWITGPRWPGLRFYWPLAQESYFAAGACQLFSTSEGSSDWIRNRELLRPLLDPDLPFRPMARLLLAMALNAKLPEVALMATDVLVGALEDGRIDGQTLGESLRTAWRLRIETWQYRPSSDVSPETPPGAPFVKPTRWVKTLGDVARASPLHAEAVATAVEWILVDAASSARTTSSLLPLLDLLKETSIESGRAVSAEARGYLNGLKSGGRTGNVVRELLALTDIPESPSGPMRRAKIQALDRRIERAERWAAWERSPS
jgi:hypothetical protein